MSDHDFQKELDDAYPIQKNRLSKQNVGFIGANRNKFVDLGIGGVSLNFDTASPNERDCVGSKSHLAQPIAGDTIPEDLEDGAQSLAESLIEPEPSDSSKDLFSGDVINPSSPAKEG
jgi:hypothetical protein